MTFVEKGTCERFFVGRKTFGKEVNADDWKDVVLNDTANLYTSHSFSAPVFDSLMHSSKPLEFYTNFLPKFVEVYAKFEKKFSFYRKLDLFTRQTHPNFLSVGLQYNGVRMNLKNSVCDFCKKNIFSHDEEFVGHEDESLKFVACANKKECGRVWHKQCGANILEKEDDVCFYCLNKQPLLFLTKVTNSSLSNTRLSSENILKNNRPLKRMKQTERRVKVKGPGKTWWTGIAKSETNNLVCVIWDNPNKHGPKEEMVERESIEWIF